MPPVSLNFEDLLKPVGPEQPSGTDLRFTSDWKKLEDARRADDTLDQGAWETERKSANWPLVLAFSSKLLTEKSKDLRVAMFLVEAKVRLDGFAGLAEGLKFTRSLLEAFWAQGLHPLPDQAADGKESFESRAKALDWLNEKLADVVRSIPITFSTAVVDNYDYARYLDARKVGREKDYEEGKASSEKRESFAAAKREGLYLDLFDEAVKLSKREPYEQLQQDLQAAMAALQDLQLAVKEKFGDSETAPGFPNSRETMEEINGLLAIIFKNRGWNKAPEQQAPQPGVATAEAPAGASDGTLPKWDLSSTAGNMSGAWAEAEALVHAGQVDRGLAQMALLAKRETSGRNRFHRKLLLAEICLKTRPRLARTILEELAEQIDKYKLDEWETTDVVGGVWTRLYAIYVETSQAEKAAKLYDRLCRLDPWQTMACPEE